MSSFSSFFSSRFCETAKAYRIQWVTGTTKGRRKRNEFTHHIDWWQQKAQKMVPNCSLHNHHHFHFGAAQKFISICYMCGGGGADVAVCHAIRFHLFASNCRKCAKIARINIATRSMAHIHSTHRQSPYDNRAPREIDQSTYISKSHDISINRYVPPDTPLHTHVTHTHTRSPKRLLPKRQYIQIFHLVSPVSASRYILIVKPNQLREWRCVIVIGSFVLEPGRT